MRSTPTKGGDYLGDQDCASSRWPRTPRGHLRDGPLGLPVQPLRGRTIAQRPFGGAGFPRCCYGADKTGHYLLHTLVEQAYKHAGEDLCRAVRARPDRP